MGVYHSNPVADLSLEIGNVVGGCAFSANENAAGPSAMDHYGIQPATEHVATVKGPKPRL